MAWVATQPKMHDAVITANMISRAQITRPPRSSRAMAWMVEQGYALRLVSCSSVASAPVVEVRRVQLDDGTVGAGQPHLGR
jgi:hypothetical protein